MTQFAQQIAFGEPALARKHVETDDRFAALVDRQSCFLFRVAYAVLRNAHDAEDAVQEAFLKLYRNRSWESMDNERAFLARTVWRIAVDRLPNRSKDQPDSNTHSTGLNPEEAVIGADLNATVHRLIDSLPEELRQPLALSTVEDLNSRQIAEVIGIPEGTVRTRLMRAREILKTKLAALMERPNAR